MSASVLVAWREKTHPADLLSYRSTLQNLPGPLRWLIVSRHFRNTIELAYQVPERLDERLSDRERINRLSRLEHTPISLCQFIRSFSQRH
jgi:hypothetical protein